MRIAALMIIGIVCSAVGSYLAERLHKRVVLLEKTETMISIIYNEIKYISLPSIELIDLLSEKTELKELSFLSACKENINRGESFPVSWKNSLMSCNEISSLNSKDIDLMISFGEGFGTTDNDGQLSKCSLFLELLKLNYNDAVNNYKRYSKLFKSLGVLTGLSMIIVFY